MSKTNEVAQKMIGVLAGYRIEWVSNWKLIKESALTLAAEGS